MVGDLVLRELEKDWDLAFPPGWNAPESLSLERLVPWSGLEDPAVRAFSGSAVYSTTFKAEAPVEDKRLMLDLGHVANIAEIVLNDEPVATLWAPPFRADVTELVVAGDNLLEIEVTNTWRNRLAYDASLPEAERRTWTIHAPAADAAVEPAGIAGPVLLREGRVLKGIHFPE